MNVPSGYSALDLVGFTDRGDYSPSETYVKNDLVHYNDKIWKCLIDDTTGIVPTTGLNWDIWIDQSNSLNGLADVEITNATDGQELSYDATTQKWKNTSKIQSLTNQVKGHWFEGGKNLLPNGIYGTHTKSGISFTRNSDGSIDASGTNTDSEVRSLSIIDAVWGNNTQGEHQLIDEYFDRTKEYVMSISDTDIHVALRILFYDANKTSISGSVINTYTKTNISFPSGAVYFIVRLIVSAGATITTGTVYPMICLKSVYDLDPSYQPYAKTNQQLTEDTTALLDNLEVNGAVNMLPNNATTQTINGITFTVNDDGTVTADGTATASTELVLTSSVKLGNKAYKVSGCPSGGSHNTYKIDVQIVGGTYVAEEVGKGYIFTASSSNTYKIRIRIIEGTTISDLTFKPMITVPSYNGPYVPYAKSNKELTEDVAELNDFEQLPSDLITASDSSVITNLTVINSYKYGHIAIVNFEFKSTSTNLALNTGYMAIKNGYRPKSFVNATLTNATSGKAVLIGVWTNGGIQIQGNPPLQNETVRGSLVYFI